MTTIAISVIGKIAASVPMRVPITALVSGAIAVMKMMNGIGRTIFTTTLNPLKIHALDQRFPGLVAYRITPMTSPSRPPISSVTPTSSNVSQMDWINNGRSSGPKTRVKLSPSASTNV